MFMVGIYLSIQKLVVMAEERCEEIWEKRGERGKRD